jgi:hypothetical protein
VHALAPPFGPALPPQTRRAALRSNYAAEISLNCQGVGFARTPYLWLKPGDSVTIDIEKIGLLTNSVAASG